MNAARSATCPTRAAALHVDALLCETCVAGWEADQEREQHAEDLGDLEASGVELAYLRPGSSSSRRT